jgi:hypothetical protein
MWDASVSEKHAHLSEQLREVVFGHDGCNPNRFGFFFQNTSDMQREQDNGNNGKKLSEYGGRLQAIHVWHGEVQNNQIRLVLANMRYSFCTIFSFRDIETRGLKRTPHAPSDYRVVIYDQHVFWHSRSDCRRKILRGLLASNQCGALPRFPVRKL